MIARLHYISQETETFTHITAIQRALDAGCNWIQLRVKKQPPSQVLLIAKQVKTICDAYQAALIINDFPEIAHEVQAAGLHLGLKDMPLTTARGIIGSQRIIGGTANTFEDILQRVAEGADYIGLGPYRFTTTKENLSPVLGLAGYQRILMQMHNAGIQVPIIAIGGIRLADVAPLLQTGVHGIAVSGALTHAGNPKAFVDQFYQSQVAFTNQ